MQPYIILVYVLIAIIASIILGQWLKERKARAEYLKSKGASERLFGNSSIIIAQNATYQEVVEGLTLATQYSAEFAQKYQGRPLTTEPAFVIFANNQYICKGWDGEHLDSISVILLAENPSLQRRLTVKIPFDWKVLPRFLLFIIPSIVLHPISSALFVPAALILPWLLRKYDIRRRSDFITFGLFNSLSTLRNSSDFNSPHYAKLRDGFEELV